MAKRYWLMKSEPDVFSLENLKAEKTTWWEGVRNYQARNHMQEMTEGDEVLFYHSRTEPPGVAGLAKVARTAEPDKLQYDKKSEYYEPAATKEKPRWFCVQVGFVAKFKNYVSLEQLKADSKLKNMLVIKRGMRLSVQPVTPEEFAHIKKLGGL